MSKNLEKIKRKRATLRMSTMKLIVKIQVNLDRNDQNPMKELRESHDLLAEKKLDLRVLDD